MSPPPPELDPFVEAARDVIGILRAMYRAERQAHRRVILSRAGSQLKEAVAEFLAHPEEGPYRASARARADEALNGVFHSLHFQESLQPVLGAAATHLRKLR